MNSNTGLKELLFDILYSLLTVFLSVMLTTAYQTEEKVANFPDHSILCVFFALP